MTLVALKDMSLGDALVERGQEISRELQQGLPPGRVESLKAQRFVEELPEDSANARAIRKLEARVAKLEGKRGAA